MRSWLVAVLLLLPAASAAADPRAGLLGAARAGDPLEIALEHLRERQDRLGVAPGERARWQVTDQYTSARDGVTHLYLRQELGGIPVWNRTLALAVAPDGRLAGLRIGWVDPARARGRARAPALAADDAVWRAAAALGLSSADAIDLDAVEPELVYLEEADGSPRLCWRFDLREAETRFWWELLVDATTGELRAQLDRIRHAEYTVFALPLESPDDGPRTIETDPADPLASPFGWHDTNGVPGAEFTRSEGNNVAAADNSRNGPIVTYAQGGPSLIFNPPLDLGQPPADNQEAATVNLFYWVNVLHDLHFQYGFDEAAGNFQSFHYGPSASGDGDEVLALSQDYTSENNASMATPADGGSPTLRMHVWSVPVTRVLAPAALAGRNDTGDAEFGPGVSEGGVTGDLVQAEPYDACSPLTNGAEIAGNVALVLRGDCNFIDKVDHAETAGAIAVLVANNVDGGVFTMAKPQGSTPSIDVPSGFVRRALGEQLAAELALGETVTVSLSLDVRDSALDDTVIVHEYGHGVSTRLVGGKSNASCLLSGQGAGMGEGWSDFWALVLTAKTGQAGEDARGMGTYLVGNPGIRNFPYSTDLAENPQTFVDVGTTNAPHGIGEIWAQALWDLYWRLVDAQGFDPDLYAGSGGNNTALQLVMDGLELTPCDPDFLDARDALLLADVLSHGGAHECRIWRAFAKRGIGAAALAAPLVEDFALPASCPLCGDANVDGLLEPVDADAIRTELAFPGTFTPAELADCDDRALSGSCDVAEVAWLLRGFAGLAPGLEGTCSAVTTP